MKENQKKENRSFSYTRPYEEAHVTADLSAKAMLMIAMLCDQVEQNKSYGELIQTKDALSKFGFSNSQSAKLLGEMTPQMQQYTEATNTLAFMEEVWQKFGKEAMVVRYDHFFEILEKYDMVCGSFDRYTGAIPQEAIDTLNRLSEMWEQKQFSQRYGLKLGCAKDFTVTNEDTAVQTMINRIRMPLRVSDDGVMAQICSATGIKYTVDGKSDLESLTDALFIAAPAADMKPLEMNVKFRTPRYEELRNAEYPEPEPELYRPWRLSSSYSTKDDQMFEKKWLSWVGKRNEFNDISRGKMRKEEERLKNIFRASDINRYAKIDFISEEPEIVRILRDPFICSLTRYGVLIHAKWGAEAEDATIKRYEQLRDAIMGKGGER